MANGPLVRRFVDGSKPGGPGVQETLTEEQIKTILKVVKGRPKLISEVRSYWERSLTHTDEVVPSDHFMPELMSVVRSETRYDTLFVWEILEMLRPEEALKPRATDDALRSRD